LIHVEEDRRHAWHAEVTDDRLGPTAGDAGAKLGVTEHAQNRLGQRRRIAVDHRAEPPLSDPRGQLNSWAYDDRKAGGDGLEHGNAEVLIVRRKYEHVGATQTVDLGLTGDESDKLDTRELRRFETVVT
jgi:hypothetical protein